MTLAIIAAVTVVAFLLTTAIVPAVRRLARGGGLYEQPVEDRWHRRPTPKLGGVAMAAVFVPIGWYVADSLALRMLLVASTAMFVLGLFDDLRPVRPVTKFIPQFATAALFLAFAPGTGLTGEPVVDLLLAFLWFVGITNAFNLLDNIDGLAAGVAAIAGAFFVAALLLNGSPSLSGLAGVVAALTGVTLGFLVYNWHPASIFMGDGGSHLLGSFLAGATLLAVPYTHDGSQAGVTFAVVILLVPCADTALVILTRNLDGRSAFVGGRDHLSHRMVAIGFPERRAVLVLYGIAIAGGGVALGLQNLTATVAWALAAVYAVMVAAIGVYLGHVDVRRRADAPSRPLPLVADLTTRYPGYEILFDGALIALAYYVGLVMRFHATDNFSAFLSHFLRVLPLVAVLHLSALWMVGRYRRPTESSALAEALIILKGSALGSTATVVALLYLTRFEGYSREAFAVAAVFVVLFLSGGHLVLRAVDDWVRRRRAIGPRTLVYGAGRRGALAVRELLNNHDLGLVPVGLVDDDPLRAAVRLEGLPVIGTLDDLDGWLTKAPERITTVIVSVRNLRRDRFDRLCEICDHHHVEVRQLRFSIDDVGADRRERVAGVIRFPRA